MKVQVCIIGGGPSGLLLSQLLHLQGIDTVVLEKYSRDRVLARIRAGVLEHGFAKLMREAQCGERMDREGEIHKGFHIAHDGALDHVDLHKYSGGNSVMVYGQTELTRDLYEARDRLGGNVVHNAEDVALHDLKSDAPYVTYRNGDSVQRVFDLRNVGHTRIHALALTTVAVPSTPLVSDPVNGLQIRIDRCTKAWRTPPHGTGFTCPGQVTQVLAQ